VDANETAELNENAVGLVATDLDFGIAVMQSNSPVFSLLSTFPGLGLLAELLRPRYLAVRERPITSVSWDSTISRPKSSMSQWK